jgi:hypothetical protein
MAASRIMTPKKKKNNNNTKPAALKIWYQMALHSAHMMN